VEICSFSSLHRLSLLHAASEPTYAEQPPRNDDDRPEPLPSAALPGGPVTGDLLHALLEQIDYRAVAAAPNPAALLKPGSATRALIERLMAEHPLEPLHASADFPQACRAELARLVWNALHTPLTATGGTLGKLPPAQRLHELEFHYPVTHGQDRGFVNGFIDLVFRRGEAHFLADWKSNLLPVYAPEAIAADMQERGYTLQMKLYAVAFVRWLQRVKGAEFDFQRHVGGAYYLYLRGMNGADDRGGVFFHRLTGLDEIGKYEHEIRAAAGWPA
jgi:ATP-dependent exoDNAse (exonuclease V) beta subunit